VHRQQSLGHASAQLGVNACPIDQWRKSEGFRLLDEFALLHGAGNGILTIARGTLPLAIFGPENYAYRLGLIGAPSRIAQALAPLGFGLLIDPMGRGVVAVSSLLSLAALVALLLLPSPTRSASQAASPSQ
jgi:hypothetical protein